MSELVKVLTDSDFNAEMQKCPTPLLVDFWAPRCIPCRAMSRIVEELAAEHAGRVAFAKVNVDDSPRVSGTYGIMGLPTFVLFHKGQPAERLSGSQSKDKFQTILAKYAGAPASGNRADASKDGPQAKNQQPRRP
jgi:thioredoxin 1